MTPLEAMASGLPVILTDNCYGGDVVRDGENGLIVPAGDAGAVADALRVLAANPAAARRIGAAGAVTAGEFTWARYRDAFQRLFETQAEQVPA